MTSRKFVHVFVATWCAGLLVMLAAAIYVNPWGNFGDVGISRNLRSRPVKVQRMAGMTDEELPQVIVLGSSNTMGMKPSTIRAELGKSAFNLGVFWGKAEDYLCLLRWLVLDRHHVPEIAIVGLDAWTIAPGEDDHPVFPGLTRELLNTPELIRHHPDVTAVPALWSRVIDSFSQGILKEYYRLLRGYLDGQPIRREHWPTMEKSGVFQSDGVRVMYGDAYGGKPGNVFDAVEAGTYPITEILQEKIDSGHVEQLIHLNTYSFTQFRQRRIDYLDEFLALASERGIRVVFVLNPVHPLFWKVLDQHTQHEKNVAKLHEIITQFRAKHSAVVGVVDASHIENFGGDPSGFFDEIHPSTKNADLILGQVAKLLRENAQ